MKQPDDGATPVCCSLLFPFKKRKFSSESRSPKGSFSGGPTDRVVVSRDGPPTDK